MLYLTRVTLAVALPTARTGVEAARPAAQSGHHLRPSSGGRVYFTDEDAAERFKRFLNRTVRNPCCTLTPLQMCPQLGLHNTDLTVRNAGSVLSYIILDFEMQILTYHQDPLMSHNHCLKG